MNCPICNLSLKDSRSAEAGRTTCVCDECGVFEIEHIWIASNMANVITAEERRLLRGVVRNETDRLGRCQTPITNSTFRETLARNKAPRSAIEQLQRFIVHCAEAAGTFGCVASFPSAAAEA